MLQCSSLHGITRGSARVLLQPRVVTKPQQNRIFRKQTKSFLRQGHGWVLWSLLLPTKVGGEAGDHFANKPLVDVFDDGLDVLVQLGG